MISSEPPRTDGATGYAADTNWGPWSGILGAALLVVAAIGASVAIGLLLNIVTGASFTDFDSMIGWLPMIFFQVVMTLGAIWLAGWFKGNRWRALALDRAPPSWAHVGLYFVLLGIVSLAYTMLVFAYRPEVVHGDVETFGPMIKSAVWPAYALIIVVGAPLSEETLFRGFLQSALVRSRWLGFWGASLVTTAAWAAMHIQYSVFGLAEIVVVGMIFCWVLRRTGSLWSTIAMHGLYNGAQLVGVALRLFPWT